MALMGCHSCKVNLQDYKDVPYQKTPCATCKLATQSTKTFKHINLYQTDAISDDADLDQIAGQIEDQNQSSTGIHIPQNIPARLIDQIQKACQTNLLITLSSIILKLIKLTKQYPTTAKILLIKMQHPQMSYYEIGRQMDPPCSKQNVLYHLKHAVTEFPELDSALIIDTRFSSSTGGSAIHSVAQLKNNTKVLNKLRNHMYDKHQFNTQNDIKTINQIFNMPYSTEPVVCSNYKDK